MQLRVQPSPKHENDAKESVRIAPYGSLRILACLSYSCHTVHDAELAHHSKTLPILCCLRELVTNLLRRLHGGNRIRSRSKPCHVRGNRSDDGDASSNTRDTTNKVKLAAKASLPDRAVQSSVQATKRLRLLLQCIVHRR